MSACSNQEDDIAADYLSALLAKQMEEVEDAEMLVSRVLFNSWQDKKYWLETISDDAKEMQMVSISETSGSREASHLLLSLNI